MTRRMPLVDYVEMLGEAAESGLIDRGEAAQLLADYSDGKFTPLGAARALQWHRTYRQEIRGLLISAEQLLSALTALQQATTEAERDAALTAIRSVEDQIFTKQREELRQRLREGGGI